jgi:TPR repeat protein
MRTNRMYQAADMQGDAYAALQVADMYERGTNNVPKNERRMLQWLLHASMLNSGVASYRLCVLSNVGALVRVKDL